MPSRWFLPIPDLDPSRVKLGFVHAAFSRWFDAAEGETSSESRVDHEANDKPYTISPPTRLNGTVGVELAVLTEDAEQLLLAAAKDGVAVRLGNQTRQIRAPRLLRRQPYDALSAGPHGTRWELAILSPLTFRSGDRATPLPSVATILGGLGRAWSLWCEPREPLRRDELGKVWVSDMDLTSELLTLTVGGRPLHIPAATGSLTLRCEPGVADRVAPLIRLASYAGIGSMTRRGLGVVEVHEAAARAE